MKKKKKVFAKLSLLQLAFKAIYNEAYNGWIQLS